MHFYISSGGNAGLGCVHAAVTLGHSATIVVPLSTSKYMISRLRLAGATDIVQVGASWKEADEHLNETVLPEARARGETAIYVPPFDHPDVWQGNSTITHEVVEQLKEVGTHYPITSATANGATGLAPINIDAVVCSVGGGGLFCGIMQGLDELGLQNTRVVAVETHGADSLSTAVEKKELVTLPAITSIATSLGARRVCKQAFEYGLREQVTTVRVTDAEAIEGCRRFANDERFLVEPACGVCPTLCYTGRLADLVPNLNSNSNVVLIICGGSHMSLDVMAGLLNK